MRLDAALRNPQAFCGAKTGPHSGAAKHETLESSKQANCLGPSAGKPAQKAFSFSGRAIQWLSCGCPSDEALGCMANELIAFKACSAGPACSSSGSFRSEIIVGPVSDRLPMSLLYDPSPSRLTFRSPGGGWVNDSCMASSALLCAAALTQMLSRPLVQLPPSQSQQRSSPNDPVLGPSTTWAKPTQNQKHAQVYSQVVATS